jgi:hypothetical protein
VWAHLSAAAVLAYQIGSGHLVTSVLALAMRSKPDVAGSFTIMSEIVDGMAGVHFTRLFDAVPHRVPDGKQRWTRCCAWLTKSAVHS